MLRILMKSIHAEEDMTSREILLVLMLHAQLEKEYDFLGVDFQNHHWLLLTNVLSNNQKITELILIELPKIYDDHPVYLTAVCHYLLKIVKQKSLKDIMQCVSLKSRHTFIDTMGLLLLKVIK